MDPSLAIVVMAKSSFSFGLVFIYCEIGEQVTARFDEINDTFYEMDWQLFPIATQRMMPTILMVAQNPVRFNGYGNIPAVRGTFKKVT